MMAEGMLDCGNKCCLGEALFGNKVLTLLMLWHVGGRYRGKKLIIVLASAVVLAGCNNESSRGGAGDENNMGTGSGKSSDSTPPSANQRKAKKTGGISTNSIPAPAENT